MMKFLKKLREKLFGKTKVSISKMSHIEPIVIEKTNKCVCGKENCQGDNCKCSDNCSCKKEEKTQLVKPKAKTKAKSKKKGK